MESPDSSPRRRPPDAPAVKRRRVTVGSRPANKPGRHSGWMRLRQRLRAALAQVRALMFVHIDSAAKCLQMRGILQMHTWTISWMVMPTVLRSTTRSGLNNVLIDLEAMSKLPLDKKPEVVCLDNVLSRLLAHVLLGHASEYQPLVSKMSAQQQYQLENMLGSHVRSGIDCYCPQQPVSNIKSWFHIMTQPSLAASNRSLHDLRDLTQTRQFTRDMDKHNERRETFERKIHRPHEIYDLTRYGRVLRDTNEVSDDELVQAGEELKLLKEKQKLLMYQMRRYRLFPTVEQQHKLRSYMGTCRWTYNQCVAHFKKTKEYNAIKLVNLYVTQKSRTHREYPEGMASPPDWVYETPSSFRSGVVRRFQHGVQSAFSNMKKKNISHFCMGYKSRKKCRFFTICEDSANAKIAYSGDMKRAFLSILKLKNIPMRCKPGVTITNEIQISNINGFWYATIPQLASPHASNDEGRCIALDPGLKAFLTGVDLNGNAIHIGRDNCDHLTKIKNRISRAQHDIATIKNSPNKRSHKQWAAHARAKRAFHAATAKLNNSVKELHYQAASYLAKNYDTIILPIFKTQEMVRRSSTRNHIFNDQMLGLKHYQFRQLLKAKCELLGKCLVVCGENYTSMTCGRCGRLHLRLGSRDVFVCPHCGYMAGRDVNAAFNILRFVCGGSLPVHKEQGAR